MKLIELPQTQSAPLRLQEKVTAGKNHNLQKPFFVLATQNPIEQEGTILWRLNWTASCLIGRLSES